MALAPLIAAAVSLLALAAEPGPVPEDLLKRLADRDAQISRLYQEGSVTLSSTVEELDGNGGVGHSQELVVRLSLKDGKQATEVVRATRDGKDVTEDERAAEAEKRAQAEVQPKPKGAPKRKVELSTPFGATAQPDYSFRVLGPDQNDPKKLRVAFGPKGKPSKDLWVGEAIVDPETGALLWMKQHPSDLPLFVNQMDMVIEFFAQTELGNAVSKLRIEGEGGPPFFKRKFRSVTSFSDYSLK